LTCKKVTEDKIENEQGDCLVAAAIIVFLGQFDQKIRDNYTTKWTKRIIQVKIPCNKKLPFNSHFLPHKMVSDWVEKGLPNDSFTIQSAIIK
jgi:hypothetical protein